MRSHLTRLVFRQLIANERITYHGCLRSAAHPRQRLVSRATSVQVGGDQRRGFFEFFRGPQRTARDADFDPGLEKMMEYSKMARLGARLPPPEDVARAFTSFVKDRGQEVPVEDEQARYIFQSFEYLKRELPSVFTPELVKDALRMLHQPPKQATISHVDLALGLYRACHETNDSLDAKTQQPLMVSCVKALTSLSASRKARDLLDETFRALGSQEDRPADAEASRSGRKLDINPWIQVLKGFALERDERELLHTLDIMESYGFAKDHVKACVVMCKHYAQLDRVSEAREWYERLMNLPHWPTASASARKSLTSTYTSLVDMCLRKRELEWGQSIIRDILSAPSKPLWDLVFIWAAGTGKGVDEIDRMMGVMEKSKDRDDSERWGIDIQTINKLVKLATDRNDPYMAERFIELGRRRGVQPDEITYQLQTDYRLSVNDVDGAIIAYQNLQKANGNNGGSEEVATMNRLICAMCGTGRHDFESIMNVAADLSDLRARFAPETVATLAILHLTRGELLDVIDLLNTHVFHYSTAERGHVRDTLAAYSLNPKTDTTAAWDTYTITRQIFDEMQRPQRTEIMRDFYHRSRPDMAVQVFTDMRRHSRPDTVATSDTYVASFMGSAEQADEESLEVVHNLLKLDYSIEPNTRLLNALIMGYTECDNARRALAFWDDIAKSREGPSLSSIHLAMRACARAPYGDLKAREIWQKLSRTGIELDQTLWVSYAGGLIGNGNVEGTITEVEEARENGMLVIDARILGTMYNAAPGRAKRKDVREWAQERYPEQWAKLEGVGLRTTETGLEHYDVNIKVEP